MSDVPTLEIGDVRARRADGAVPPPLPPDDPDAWYAPDVRSQYEVHPGVVATIREADHGFEYRIREPSLDDADRRALSRIREHFTVVDSRRPLTALVRWRSSLRSPRQYHPRPPCDLSPTFDSDESVHILTD